MKVEEACGEEKVARHQSLEVLGVDMAEAAAALDVLTSSQRPLASAVPDIIAGVSPKADCLNICMIMM